LIDYKDSYLKYVIQKINAHTQDVDKRGI